MAPTTIGMVVLFGMFALSIYFWYLEGIPIIDKYKKLSKVYKPIDDDNYFIIKLLKMIYNVLQALFIILSLIPIALPLLIDLFITIMLTSTFNLGGNIGGAAALFASNCISYIIVLTSRRS